MLGPSRVLVECVSVPAQAENCLQDAVTTKPPGIAFRGESSHLHGDQLISWARSDLAPVWKRAPP